MERARICAGPRRGCASRRPQRIYAGAAQPARKISSISGHDAVFRKQSDGADRSLACPRVGRTLQSGTQANRSLMDQFEAIAQALRSASLDGWLFYDFRVSDPLAYRILGLDEHGLTT